METTVGVDATPAPAPPKRHHPRIRLGRKDYVAGFALIVPVATTTALAFLAKMSAETYVGFLQLYIPAIVGLYSGANVAQKALAKKAPDAP